MEWNQPNFSNRVFNSLKTLFEKRGIKEYRKRLERYLANNTISPDEMSLLQSCAKKFSLTYQETKILQKEALATEFKRICADRRISDKERISLEDLLNQFGLSVQEINFDQIAFNRYSSLESIEQGNLPIIGNKEILNIVFKTDEIVHFAESANLIKLKSITTRINYGGISASIKIMKGVRYRIGSLNVQTETQKIHKPEDAGFFYITNQRIGFIGVNKQFTFPLKKIHSLEVYPEGLYLFKEGKESAYIISLGDYETPLSILSFIINQ